MGMTGQLEQTRNMAIAKLATWILIAAGVLIAATVDDPNVRVGVLLVGSGVLGGTWWQALR